MIFPWNILSLILNFLFQYCSIFKDHPATVVQRSENQRSARNSARSESPILGHRDRTIKINDRGPGGHRPTSSEKTKTTTKKNKEKKSNNNALERDKETLLMQIQALQAQLEEEVIDFYFAFIKGTLFCVLTFNIVIMKSYLCKSVYCNFK